MSVQKYLIELEDVYVAPEGSKNGPERLYRVKGFNSLVFDDEGLKKLQRVSKMCLSEQDYTKLKTHFYDAGYAAAKRDFESLGKDSRSKAYKEGYDAGYQAAEKDFKDFASRNRDSKDSDKKSDCHCDKGCKRKSVESPEISALEDMIIEFMKKF